MSYKLIPHGTGVDCIRKEREEQINYHNYDADHDRSHDCGELLEAALHVLTHGALPYPAEWGLQAKRQFRKKDEIDRLAVGGALIAAEIDRLVGIDMENNRKWIQANPNVPEVPKVMVDGIPRRYRSDMYTEEEKAISSALRAVEDAGAHPYLTKASELLLAARNEVANFVESQGTTDG